MIYDYDACDGCQLATCTFDDAELTEAQQNTICPAVIGGPSATKPAATKGIKYRQWRAEKLELIRQELADRRTPIPLAELPDLVGVPMKLIRSWRVNFMEAELIRSLGRRGRGPAHITGVSLTRTERKPGHDKVLRQKRLALLRELLADRGALSVAEISKELGIHTSVLHYWIGRYVIGEKRRVDHWDGRNKEIMYILKIIIPI